MSFFRDNRIHYQRDSLVKCCLTCHFSNVAVIHEVFETVECLQSFTEVNGERHFTRVCPVGVCDIWRERG